MHIGTHGSLEWLPGKGVAMGDECYPDICTGDLPNVYPYWVVDTGEGIQAKRRSVPALSAIFQRRLALAVYMMSWQSWKRLGGIRAF